MRTRSSAAALRARLDRVTAAGEVAHGRSSLEAKALMEERARRLAEAPAAAVAREVVEVVTFALAGERYALETRHVREVIRAGEVTRVPGTPPFVLGLTNLRGDLLVVVDLRQLFGFPLRELTPGARIAVMGGAGSEMGVVMDAVDEVTTLWRDELLDVPAHVDGVDRACVAGISRDGCILLDGGRLLEDPRLFVEQS